MQNWAILKQMCFFLQGFDVIIGLATVFVRVTQEAFRQTSLVVLLEFRLPDLQRGSSHHSISKNNFFFSHLHR